jgi:hypothetical protein
VRTIHKYALPLNGEVHFDMPAGARVRHVEYQGESGLALWAEVDLSEPVQIRHFEVRQSGKTWDERSDIAYVGTAMVHGGRYVMHVYEVLSPEAYSLFASGGAGKPVRE